MARSPTIGYEYSIQWHNPKTEPPPGMARVLVRAFAASSRPEDKPEAIARKAAELEFGSGWVICSQAITPPPRRHSAEQKGKRRVGNLQRRVRKAVGPLFAQAVIDAELARKPDDYAGAEVSREGAAYVAECDAEDARLWAAYLEWHAQVTGEASGEAPGALGEVA
ncbi:hypothetical protein [Deinococcus petrolearius]|uniref:Uncharacterized protein n=1 Tax=Deinococcus petrolearius TaxID=1751295 RepID=A0ABW1DL04_9DEIO